MKSEKLLNIIVPIYNSEKHLKNCLNSILGQTYKNIKLLCIDDGSSDSSPEIIDKYAKIDSRIFVIHKSNGGVGSARNMGLDQLDYSIDSYISFIDSDDYVENDYFELMIKRLETDDSDIVASTRTIVNENGKTVRGLKTYSEDCVIDGFQATKDVVRCNITPGVVMKVYKTALLKKKRFKEDIFIGEDTEFTYRVFALSNKVSIYHCPKYINNRFSGDVSLGKSKWNNKRLISSFRCDYSRCLNKIDNFSNQQNEEIMREIYNDIADGFLELYPRFSFKTATSEEKKFIKGYKKYINKNGIIKAYVPFRKNAKIKKYSYLYLRFLYRFMYKFFIKN